MAGHVLSPPTPSWHRRPQYALQQLRAYRCRAMIAAPLFAMVRNLFFPISDYLCSPQSPVLHALILIHRLNCQDVIGATNSKQTTKLESAIVAMLFIVGGAMKWINARIAARSFVTHVQRS